MIRRGMETSIPETIYVCFSKLVFQFDADDTNLSIADILNRMCKQRRRPRYCSSHDARFFGTGIENGISLVVSPNEIARTEDVEHTRPAMRVNRNGLARLDARVQDSHSLVFKQDFMMIWRSNHCIQRVRPFLFELTLLCVMLVHSLLVRWFHQLSGRPRRRTKSLNRGSSRSGSINGSTLSR